MTFKKLTVVPLILCALALVLALALVWTRLAQGAGVDIVVTTTSPTAIPDGVCSLPEAITASNDGSSVNGDCVGTIDHDTIVFDVGTGTPFIPTTFTGLPHITTPVTIDGNTGGADRIELRGPGGPLISGLHGLTLEPTAFGSLIKSLVINNQADDGILIDADAVGVIGSFIGTSADGMSAMPNQGFGIQVKSSLTRIGGGTNGGPCTGGCNLISGALIGKANVLLDIGSSDVHVSGNFIGTDVTGAAAMVPNQTMGVVDKGLNNTIGGVVGVTPAAACTGECNLISGNAINGGIVAETQATGSLIQGNFIGTDVTGTLGISNGLQPGFSVGVLSYTSNGVTIGGTAPEARNVIAGNRGANVQVRGLGAVVQGNYIGTNSAGTGAIANSAPGIHVNMANGAMIGGSAEGAGNLISGASTNGAFGILITGSTNVVLLGNVIGAAADGVTPLPNTGDGVYVNNMASNNIIGGLLPEFANSIAFNGGIGVRIDAALPQVRSNTVSGNSIHSNVGPGIDLQNGANDNLQAPVISSVNPLTGTACAMCTIEVFSDGADEGRVYEGNVLSDNAGNWTFANPVSGPFVTATATDNSNNTSEFSLPRLLQTFTYRQGDVNCDGEIDGDDVTLLLEYAAGLNDGVQDSPCLDLGEPFVGHPWGDLNCDGLVNVLDALALLVHLSGVGPTPPPAACAAIGDDLLSPD